MIPEWRGGRGTRRFVDSIGCFQALNLSPSAKRESLARLGPAVAQQRRQAAGPIDVEPFLDGGAGATGGLGDLVEAGFALESPLHGHQAFAPSVARMFYLYLYLQVVGIKK